MDSPLNDPLAAIFRRFYSNKYCFATSLSEGSFWPKAAPSLIPYQSEYRQINGIH